MKIIFLVILFIYSDMVDSFASEEVSKVTIASEAHDKELASLFDVYKQIVEQARRKIHPKVKEKNAVKTKDLIVSPLSAQLMDKAKARANQEPLYLIRGLEILQDKMVTSDEVNSDDITAYMVSIYYRMLQLKPEVWQDKANMYALCYYILSGGNAKLFALIMQDTHNKILPKTIIDGVAAYARYDKNAFVKAFAAENTIEKSPLYFQAIVNLRMASYYRSVDITKAVDRLNQVRILTKASALEEEAIREEIDLVAKQGNLALLKLLGENYVKLFTHSPYIRSFWHQYIFAIGLLKDKLKVNELEKVLLPLPALTQDFVYVNVAKQRLLEGDIKSAKDFSLKALAIEDTNNYETNRALLYYATSLSFGSYASNAKVILDRLDPSQLSDSDKILLYAAQKIIAYLIKDPQNKASVSNKPEMLNQSNEEKNPEDIDIQSLNKANENIVYTIDSSVDKLKDVDRMLQTNDDKYIY